MAPFPIRNPTPWTDTVAGFIMTFYISMYIAAGTLERLAPQTMAWARKEAQRVRERTGR